MGKVSAMSQLAKLTQPFIPPGSVNEVVIYVITWTTGVETITRQTRAAYCRMGAGQSRGRGLGLWHRLYACSVCDTQRRCSGTVPLVVLY